MSWAELWIEYPASQSIADHLNQHGAVECIHHRDPCFLRCGVQRVLGVWQAISPESRHQWRENVAANTKGSGK